MIQHFGQFVSLRTSRSSPTALHLASRRRSYLRLSRSGPTPIGASTPPRRRPAAFRNLLLAITIILLSGFQFQRATPAKPDRNDSKHTERTIHNTPPDGNPPNRPKNKRIRNNETAGNHSEAEEPAIADRIAQRPEKRHGDDKVAEREPIGAVEEHRMPRRSLVERRLRFRQPNRPGRRSG